MIIRNPRYKYKLRINDAATQVGCASGSGSMLRYSYSNKDDRWAELISHLEGGLDLSASPHIAYLFFEEKGHHDLRFVTLILDYGITCCADLNNLNADNLKALHTDILDIHDYGTYRLIYRAYPHMEKLVRERVSQEKHRYNPSVIYQFITPTEFFYEFEFGEQPKTNRKRLIEDAVNLVLSNEELEEARAELLKNDYKEKPENIEKILIAAYKQKNDIIEFKNIAGGHVSLRENLDENDNSTFIFYKSTLDLCMGYLTLKKNHATEEELKAYRAKVMAYYRTEIQISANPMHKTTCMNKLKRSDLYADALAKDDLMLDIDGLPSTTKLELAKKAEATKMAGTTFKPAVAKVEPKESAAKAKSGSMLSRFSFRKK